MSIKVEVWRNFEAELNNPEKEYEINLEIASYLQDLRQLGWQIKDYEFADKDDYESNQVDV